MSTLFNRYVGIPKPRGLSGRVAVAIAALVFIPAFAQERTNYFNDPFVQITSAIASCPVPAGPLYTAEQVRQEEHGRVQRGVSCHTAGRCRLPNSYLYDKEIIPRVAIAVNASGRFTNTSIWALGQRRIVTLMGCVQSEDQLGDVEALIRNIDDVEGVVNQLMVGPRGKPLYEVAPSGTGR